MIHNPITRNFQRMLLHYLEVLSQAQSGQAKAVDAAANATYLLSSILKCIAESAPSSCLQSLFDAAPNLPQVVQGRSRLLRRYPRPLSLGLAAPGSCPDSAARRIEGASCLLSPPRQALPLPAGAASAQAGRWQVQRR